ncbi:ImmA/IrrE family metallo-endopeptidase [Pseudomonas sp. CP4]|uniref:ImmA/IrrE family metallo-endopeptidase n=1 Tax=Pseudomonas sp. CP4 TaxID=3388844 RepID=UPI0039F132A3
MDRENLSTYAKGDKFEEQVFQFLTREIHEGRFFCRSEHCQIYRKRSYYSRDREDSIIFDIAIEVFLPGLEKPSMIVIIECKNYSGTVPVCDIEEFSAKVSQVTGFNVKGIFASMSAFQSGTFNIARNKGFGLLRYFDQSEFRWELPRALLTGTRSTKSRKRAEIEYALTNQDFRPTIYSAYAVTPSGYTDGWDGIWKGLDVEAAFSDEELRLIHTTLPTSKLRVPFVSKDSLEDLAEQVLKSISYNQGFVDLNKVISHERDSNGLIVRFFEENHSALGSITFNPLEIKIFTLDEQSHLARFTLAHELGHYFLKHGRYMSRESIHAQDIDQSQFITVPKGEVERLEWQANMFASCLLMPQTEFNMVLSVLVKRYGIRNRGHGTIYLDEQSDNLTNFRMIAAALSRYFKVSLTAVRLRMKALGHLVEA